MEAITGNEDKSKMIGKSFTLTEVGVEGDTVYGFALISKIDGEPYYDLHGHYIPEDVVEKVAKSFSELPVLWNHVSDSAIYRIGKITSVFPLTTEIYKMLGVDNPAVTGLLIGIKVNKAILEEVKSGELTGFSIGGFIE